MNKRPMFIFWEPERGDMPQSVRAKKHDALMKKYGADPEWRKDA